MTLLHRIFARFCLFSLDFCPFLCAYSPKTKIYGFIPLPWALVGAGWVRAAYPQKGPTITARPFLEQRRNKEGQPQPGRPVCGRA